MRSKILLEEIEKHHYWDMGIDELNISSYFDEVSIIYFNEKKITYKFLACYKILSSHCLDYDKEGYTEDGERYLPPCFLQDIIVSEIEESNRQLYKVLIDAYPLNMEIWCKDIKVIAI